MLTRVGVRNVDGVGVRNVDGEIGIEMLIVDGGGSSKC